MHLAINSLSKAKAAIENQSLAPEIVPITIKTRQGQKVITEDEQELQRIAADSVSLKGGNTDFETRYHKEKQKLKWGWENPEDVPNLRMHLSWLKKRLTASGTVVFST